MARKCPTGSCHTQLSGSNKICARCRNKLTSAQRRQVDSSTSLAEITSLLTSYIGNSYDSSGSSNDCSGGSSSSE